MEEIALVTPTPGVTCKLDQSLLCGLLTPYGNVNQVNIGSGNGLLPDGTKPLN